MEQNNNFEDIILIFGLGILIFFIVVGFVISEVVPFFKERERIKLEMERSYSEAEYRYWRKKLKKLYRDSIPIIGRFLG